MCASDAIFGSKAAGRSYGHRSIAQLVRDVTRIVEVESAIPDSADFCLKRQKSDKI